MRGPPGARRTLRLVDARDPARQVRSTPPRLSSRGEVSIGVFAGRDSRLRGAGRLPFGGRDTRRRGDLHNSVPNSRHDLLARVNAGSRDHVPSRGVASRRDAHTQDLGAGTQELCKVSAERRGDASRRARGLLLTIRNRLQQASGAEDRVLAILRLRDRRVDGPPLRDVVEHVATETVLGRAAVPSGYIPRGNFRGNHVLLGVCCVRGTHDFYHQRDTPRDHAGPSRGRSGRDHARGHGHAGRDRRRRRHVAAGRDHYLVRLRRRSAALRLRLRGVAEPAAFIRGRGGAEGAARGPA
mmetsp:Transcript_32995/g.78157  ORF Transcript_32995/g.78157 Transcript_32995/m.78157 type:complete len:297 (-) Transcript_32995:89-979(-)